MEFFEVIDKQVSEAIIQEKVTPKTLEKFTESMFLLETIGNDFSCGTLWGEFVVSYDKIKGGVRFALLNCPNALQWTITTGFPPKENSIVIHLTINRNQKPTEFVEEIQEFLDEWINGLTNQF
ncbi:MAG: hypothetical protein IZT56_02305 [Bacteroidetes bacterium]|nr:hypothetical protein [Bacteroidota bacterium]